MAEGHGNPPVTPERIRREIVNPRRNSIGPSSLGPNYLRASTGSCHDFCKFGKAHSCEPKARNPLRRKLITRPPEDEILVKSAVFPERKKNSHVDRPRSSPGSQIPVLEAPDVLRKKGQNSDRRNPMRGGLVVEKKTNPAAMIKPSLNLSTHSLNGKKTMKKDLFSTNETSKQALRTNELSKQVQKTNDTLTGTLAKPKERRLSGIIVAPAKSSSLSLRRLSSSDSSSLLRLQKRGEMKPEDSTGIHKRVVAKNLDVPSSASPSSKPSISKKGTTKNVTKTTVVKRITLSGAPPRKSKDKVKDVEIAMVINIEKTTERTLSIANVEETPDVEETESKGSIPVTDESIDESTVVNVEETESKPVEGAASEGIVENITMNLEETESKPLETAASEGIVENIIVNIEETESKPLEAVVGESIVESNFMNVEEGERKAFDEVTSEGIVESNIVNVKETESNPLEPVIGESFSENLSPPLTVSIAESSSLSPCGSPCPSLQEEDQTESEYTMSESEDDSASEYEESDIVQVGDFSEEGDATQPRNSGPHRPECEEGSKPPRRLRFRRGRIIDVQHENNTPRRLKFRRARLLGEGQNLNPEARRSSLKRREQIEGESNNDGTDKGSAKVVLRHSDVLEKKDAKGLFNNVIEETASKLAETRKSKVKALVGAFETVISLQDLKPSANT